MTSVRAENADLKSRVDELEEEVEACRRRDHRVLTIETCVRLLVPVVVDLDPKNQTLAHVATLLRSLPVEENAGEWQDFIDRIDAADIARARS